VDAALQFPVAPPAAEACIGTTLYDATAAFAASRDATLFC
jgi:hypothetical protein